MDLINKGFSLLDYVIFGCVLFVSLAIGLYPAFCGKRQKTSQEFHLANRKMSSVPVAISLLVSFASAILVLGQPAEVYTKGTLFATRIIGYCLACIISSIVFVPLFYSLQTISCFEYLEKRFSSVFVRLLGTLFAILGNIFYMGLLLYAPSTALEAVTGFPLWLSITISSVLGTTYTVLGGMKAVIWTDVFQGIVMIGGMLAIAIQGIREVGGFQRLWSISEQGGRLTFVNFSPDPTIRLTTWSVVIGSAVNMLTLYGVGQSSVQRYCSVPKLSAAQRSVLLNIPGLILVQLLASLTGLVVYVYYANLGCDPLKAKLIKNPNQIVPYFLIDVLNYWGFPGIFLAVLFCGSLSSVDSSLNALSAITWEDILKKKWGHVSDKTSTIIAKLLVVGYGIIGTAAAFSAQLIGSHVLEASLSFLGATSGPSFGLFVLGAFFPSAHAVGAIVGFAIATVFSAWISLGSFITKPHRGNLPTNISMCFSNITSLSLSSAQYLSTTQNYTNKGYGSSTLPFDIASPTASNVDPLRKLYSISFLWYSLIGMVITVIIGVIVSLLTPKFRKPVDKKLLIDVRRTFCCCIPWTGSHKVNSKDTIPNTNVLYEDKQLISNSRIAADEVSATAVYDFSMVHNGKTDENGMQPMEHKEHTASANA